MESRESEVANNGVLSLTIRDEWWWYLDIHGQPLYKIGNNCGTCNALFSRLQNAKLPLTPQELSEQLNDGIDDLTQDAFETIVALLPKGRYCVEGLTVTPSLVTQENRPFHVSCEADYFWICSMNSNEQGVDYEVILPIVTRLQLSSDRVDFYKRKFENGLKSTALAFSMHDGRVIKGEYPQDAYAHFLLDGHHKVTAASELSLSISLLSFTRLNTYAESRA